MLEYSRLGFQLNKRYGHYSDVKEQPVQEYLTDSSGILGQIILEI